MHAGVVAGAIAGLLTALTGALVVVGMLLAEPITAVIAPDSPALPPSARLIGGRTPRRPMLTA